MILHTWAERWRIPDAALIDLQRMLVADNIGVPSPGAESEARAQQDVRLEAAELGLVLWRNNVGALADERGRWVRYGLANDSAAMNERIKSSDLVGIRPRVITPADVGRTIGQFTCREAKHPGWKWRGTEREMAQLAFLQLVIGLGGDAGFAVGRGSL